MNEKLPNLWVFGDAIEILQGGKTTHKTNISLRKIVMDDVLYIHAERIRDLRNLLAADEPELIKEGAHVAASYASYIRGKLEALIEVKP